MGKLGVNNANPNVVGNAGVPTASGRKRFTPDTKRPKRGDATAPRLQKSICGEEIVSMNMTRTSPHPTDFHGKR